jgi:hypothetical protein
MAHLTIEEDMRPSATNTRESDPGQKINDNFYLLLTQDLSLL